VFVDELGLFDRSSRVLLSTTLQKFTFDRRRKIFLVVRRGWQDGQSQKFVNHDDISSEETTLAIDQHCVFAVCIPTRGNCIYIYK